MTDALSPPLPGLFDKLAQAHAPKPKDQTAKDFEAVFVTQFVDEMMKTVDPSAFGGEKQAEMWRSFVSEAVAKTLVEQGGFGLTASVDQMIAAYKPATPTAK